MIFISLSLPHRSVGETSETIRDVSIMRLTPKGRTYDIDNSHLSLSIRKGSHRRGFLHCESVWPRSWCVLYAVFTLDKGKVHVTYDVIVSRLVQVYEGPTNNRKTNKLVSSNYYNRLGEITG